MFVPEFVLGQAIRREFDARLVGATVALVGIILLGALLLVLLNRWRKRIPEDRLSANAQLAQFRQLYEQGGMSQEEFEKVRAHLVKQAQQELQAARPTPPPLEDSSPPPPAVR